MGTNSFLIGLFLTILCASCHRERQWTQSQIVSTKKTSCSSKLIHTAIDPIYGLAFELVKTQEGIKGYLVAHSTPLSKRSVSQYTPIKYIIDKEIFTSEGYVLEGGQKILLNETLIQDLICALHLEKKIEISLTGYKTQLDGKGFPQAFQKFQTPPNYQNPFHLPF